MLLRAAIFVLCAFFAALLAHAGEEIGDAVGSIAGRKLDPKSYGIKKPKRKPKK